MAFRERIWTSVDQEDCGTDLGIGYWENDVGWMGGFVRFFRGMRRRVLCRFRRNYNDLRREALREGSRSRMVYLLRHVSDSSHWWGKLAT